MNRPSKERSDLKRNHPIILEAGLIITLTLFIIIFRTGTNGENIKGESEYRYIINHEEKIIEEKHFVELEPIPDLQKEAVIPPLLPNVPADEPVDEIVEDLYYDFDAEMDMPLEPEKLTVPLPYIEEEMDYFLAAQEMPDLENGWSNFHKDVTYPEHARQHGIQGRVYLQFIVNEKGEVEDPVVLRGIGGGCDEAALTAVKDAKFIPGYVHGEPVRVKIGMAVKFELNRLTGLPEVMLREIGG